MSPEPSSENIALDRLSELISLIHPFKLMSLERLSRSISLIHLLDLISLKPSPQNTALKHLSYHSALEHIEGPTLYQSLS